MIPRYQSEAMNKIWSEAAKYACWFDVEIAHFKAQEHDQALVDFFITKQKNIDWDAFACRVSEHELYLKHDVLAFLRALEDELGEPARKLHRGLTSSDIVDTAFALQLKKSNNYLCHQLNVLLDALWQKALESRGKLCIGRTHGQAAQPMTFAIKLLGHLCELARGHMRLKEASKVISVGKFSGAVGTYAFSDEKIESRALSFLGLEPETVATQIVARDRHAQFFTALAILAGSLERLATELRLLMHGGVREACEPFSSKQQGSSAMPHKKNPILCENITGLMRLVRSYSMAILENQALWHERDISHSSVERVVALDATSLIDFALMRMTKIITGLVLDYERMSSNLADAGSSIASQAVLVALLDKGLWRSEAYDLVQKAALATGKNFKNALIEAGVHRWLKEEELENLLQAPTGVASEALLFNRAQKIMDSIFN
jgi:adenylosuccinate lyase